MRYILFIAVLIFTVSCSVKKRNYRNGYFIDWVHHSKSKSNKNNELAKASKVLPKDNQDSRANLMASKSAGIVLVQKPKLTLLNDTCGDQILFKTGDSVSAKILEVTPTQIKYKRCDNLDGPLMVVSKQRVQTIRYVNGVLDVFEIVSKPLVVSNTHTHTTIATTPPKAIKPAAIQYSAEETHSVVRWSFIMFLFGFICYLPFIMSLLLARLAIKEIDANPKAEGDRENAELLRNASTVLLIALPILALFTLIIFSL